MYFIHYNDNKQYRMEVLLLYIICLNHAELSAGFLVIITKIKMNYLKENKIVKKKVKMIWN